MRDRKRQNNRRSCLKLAIVSIAAITVTALPASAIDHTHLDVRTQQVMVAAINDEYRARALYNAVIEKFGLVRPFSNIVQAEDRHVQLWKALFAQYQLPVPKDTFAGNIEAPETLQAACQMSIEAEIANVQMYDNFLSFVQEPSLIAAFTQLRQVSQNKHKPAFERCAGNSISSEPTLSPGRREIRHQRGGMGSGPTQ